MKTIDHYLSIAQASHDMVDAARLSNWDALVSAEEECARRIAALEDHQAKTRASIDAADQKKRIHILGKMLAHDAEIRELTTPWLLRLEELLAGGTREHRRGDGLSREAG
jgi:flagellar protein FliT